LYLEKSGNPAVIADHCGEENPWKKSQNNAMRPVGRETNKEVLRYGADQGCQIFLGTKYQNVKNIQNYHKLYQMSIKYNKRP
jgi:hypothetical protein